MSPDGWAVSPLQSGREFGIMSALGAVVRLFVKDQDRSLKVLSGPFRGGVFYSNPRASMRKVFGVYEHELNGWIDEALSRARQVIDVGGNDGYFTFGAAAAMRRMG